ncbi:MULTISPECIES: hypothetical protein [Pseudomonas]|uniref:hypothetical protein n=1 Tax=Pseudomonas TaxID=286 RepID=UPI001FF58176|nr:MULTISPECIES: hypothetical protein [Pseudomonas]
MKKSTNAPDFVRPDQVLELGSSRVTIPTGPVIIFSVIEPNKTHFLYHLGSGDPYIRVTHEASLLFSLWVFVPDENGLIFRIKNYGFESYFTATEDGKVYVSPNNGGLINFGKFGMRETVWYIYLRPDGLVVEGP